MEYSFLRLSVLSDHADLCCIECDNRTMRPAHRLMPPGLRWKDGVGFKATPTLGGLVSNSIALVGTAAIEGKLLFIIAVAIEDDAFGGFKLKITSYL